MNTQTVLKCMDCSKDFLVIDQEAKFYADKGLPNPDQCPACRHKIRMALRNERALYKRTCDCCNESMLATYPEDAPYKVYCQKCFWENVG
jgi:DNA-directed RNA polymerase subunit RPC12/RpoP